MFEIITEWCSSTLRTNKENTGEYEIMNYQHDGVPPHFVQPVRQFYNGKILKNMYV